MKTNEFKIQLNEMKEALVTSLGKIEKDKKRVNGPLEADSSDQAQSLQNNEVVDHLDEMERAELDQINAALSRIENGTFGNCSECGNEIDDKRLKALPFANVCMDCLTE